MILVALALGFNVSASHLLGGMVTVAQTNYDSTSVAVYLVSDAGGVTPPSTIYVEQWEMDSQGWYTFTGTISLTNIDKFNFAVTGVNCNYEF